VGNEIRTHDFNLGKVVSLSGGRSASVLFKRLRAIEDEQRTLAAERKRLLGEVEQLLVQHSETVRREAEEPIVDDNYGR